MNENYDILVFDTETNGLDTKTCDLLSIGWIKIRFDRNCCGFKVIDHVEYYIQDSNVHNTKESYEVNQISDQYREEYGIPINEALSLFKEAVKGSHVYAYNIEYDYNVLIKYDKTIFEFAFEIDDIMVNEYEPVINCIQRIVYHYRQRFDKFIYVRNRLHTAFDDVVAELVVLLFDKFNVNVERLLIDCEEYIPEMTVGKFKHKPVDEVINTDVGYIKWFLFSKDNDYEDYLRYYIMNKYDIPLSKNDISRFGGKLNNFFFHNEHLIRIID